MRPWTMGVWMAVSMLALLAFPGWGQGAALGDSSPEEEEGDPRKGDTGTSRVSRTTLRTKYRPTVYRAGSLSALSRGLVANESEMEDTGGKEEDPQRQEREATQGHGACWGCCGTRFPNRTGSRQPSKGDSGGLGSTPSPKPPERNATMTTGFFRPGAYTPMGRLYRSTGPGEAQQGASFPWMKTNGTQDRCRGCCGRNSTSGAKAPGRREEGKGSQNPGGGPVKRPWRPVLEGETPDQKGDKGQGFPFPVDPQEPWPRRRGP